jgi:hypothetical protein
MIAPTAAASAARRNSGELDRIRAWSGLPNGGELDRI